MKSSFHQSPWRPDWHNSDIFLSVTKVNSILRTGVYKEKLDSFTALSSNSDWLSRQFNINERAAYAGLKNTENRIQSLAGDAPRVLRRIKIKWGAYISRVNMNSNLEQRKEIIRLAKKNPAELYVYLVTVHIQKVWKRHNPGMESSLATAWSKIGSDNQFLWSMKEFESTFI